MSRWVFEPTSNASWQTISRGGKPKSIAEIDPSIVLRQKYAICPSCQKTVLIKLGGKTNPVLVKEDGINNYTWRGHQRKDVGGLCPGEGQQALTRN